MKILVGVDLDSHYKSTLNLVKRLKFNPLKVRLANSIEAGMTLCAYGPEAAPFLDDYIKIATKSGQDALDHAAEEAAKEGIEADTVMLDGNPAGSLMDQAEAAGADLIAVHAGYHGPFTLGSVSRALAIGSTKSVLITKGEIAPEGPLRVVFATDFSDYSKKALDMFIALHPGGIESIDLITAAHGGRLKKHLALDSFGEPTRVAKLQDFAHREMEVAVLKMLTAGFKCTGEVKDMSVNDAIFYAMESTHADLLVIGAQGHGYMHRLFLGSTALHQVVTMPNSVLILRPSLVPGSAGSPTGT